MIAYYIVESRLRRTGKVINRAEYFSQFEAQHHCNYINECLKTRQAKVIAING